MPVTLHLGWGLVRVPIGVGFGLSLGVSFLKSDFRQSHCLDFDRDTLLVVLSVD